MPLVLALFAGILTANAKTLSEAEYWQRTEFPPTLFRRFISNEKCASSSDYLASCRAALAAARMAAGVPAGAPDEDQDFDSAFSGLEKAAESKMPYQSFRARVVNAHLNHFDAHAAISPTEMLNASYTGENRSFVGIGVVLDPQENRLVVRETIDGSPARRAGLRPDDIILAIAKSGNTFENIEGELGRASDLILEKENTKIALRVLRDGKPVEVAMKRAQVTVPYVSGSVNNGVAYVRIFSFESQAVCRLVNEQLRFMNANQIILDLRGNPGGDKSMAVCVAELFLGPKKVVGTKAIARAVPSLNELLKSSFSVDFSPEPVQTGINWEGGYVARARYTAPMVALVDAQSASASEIVAGALQDYKRAWVVGDRTSGKGTVQHEEFLPGNPSLTVKYTSERFYQPSGRTNQIVGITPSFRVPRRKDQPLPSTLREPDLFPKSLQAENTPWTETRPEEAARIGACLNSRQGIDQVLAGFQAPGEPVDHQLATAQAVLNCM